MKKEIKIVFTSKERRMLNTLKSKYKVLETELATQFRVHQTTITRWLSGKSAPPYSTRIIIAKLYEEYKNGKDNTSK